MLGAKEIEAKIETVQDLLREKLGIRKRNLSRMLQKAGRRLPKRLHGRVQALIDAQALAQNPKLAKRLDKASVTQAFDEITAHLRKIDVAQRRKDVLLGLAGTVAFNMLVLGVAFITWLWWQGYV